MKYVTWICDCGVKCQSIPQETAPHCMDCQKPMLPAEVVSVAELAQLRANRLDTRKQAFTEAAQRASPKPPQ